MSSFIFANKVKIILQKLPSCYRFPLKNRVNTSAKLHSNIKFLKRPWN